LKKIFPGTLDPCLHGRGREKEGREGVKGFLPLKGEGGKGQRGLEGVESRRGEGPATGRILLQGLRGDRRP